MKRVGLVLTCSLLLQQFNVGVEASKKKKKKGGHDIAADAKWLQEKSLEEGVVSVS